MTKEHLLCGYFFYLLRSLSAYLPLVIATVSFYSHREYTGWGLWRQQLSDVHSPDRVLLMSR